MTILRDEPEAEICARENVIGKWVRGGFSLGRPAQTLIAVLGSLWHERRAPWASGRRLRLASDAPPSLDTPRPRLRRSLSAATTADFAPPSFALGER
jgi:hypothetical protein